MSAAIALRDPIGELLAALINMFRRHRRHKR